ncbi:MAG: HAD family hydrolase [candidate division WOR-3 bacterium]
MRKENKIKAILFDLDGVLVDTYKVWYYLFNDTLEHFGYKPIDLKTFAQNWGKSTEEDVKIFMPGVKLRAVVEYFSGNFSRFLGLMKVNTQAHTVLTQLKKAGLKIGCITNSHRQITQRELRSAHLKHLIDVIITADDVKKPKPDPEMLLKACRKLGVKTSEIIFIGDTPTDLKTANSARCIFIGYRIRTMLNIKNLEDLLPLIKRKFSL